MRNNFFAIFFVALLVELISSQLKVLTNGSASAGNPSNISPVNTSNLKNSMGGN